MRHGKRTRATAAVVLTLVATGAALQSHAVDAIWVTEPFVTQIEQTTHAREVVDSSGGQAAGLPDRGQVERIVSTYVKGLTPQVAFRMVLGHYATTTDPKRLQRVADLMLKYGFVKRRPAARFSG